MSKRIEAIVQMVKKSENEPIELSKLFSEAEAHLTAFQYKTKGFEHRGLYNREVVEFLKLSFPDIKDFDRFLDLLTNLGLKRGIMNKDFFTDAYILFDLNKSGFMLIQQSMQLTSLARNDFCLAYTIEAGKPTLRTSGIKNGRLISSEYTFNPTDEAYIRTALNVGVEKNEMADYEIKPIALERFLKNPDSILFSEKMRSKAGKKDWILSLGNKPVPNLTYLIGFPNIPQKVATN